MFIGRVMKTENYSPLNPIKKVFSGPPGVEASMCLCLPPEVSLFEPQSGVETSVVQARQDHDRMREAFEHYGIQSFNMREIIGREIVKRCRLPFRSKDQLLRELESRSLFFLRQYDISLNFDRLMQEMEVLLDQDISSMGLDPALAINAVLTNVIDHQGNYKTFNPNLPPAGNFLFWRDTNHVTADIMGTHKMFYSIRDQEVYLAEIAFDSLGIKYHHMMLGRNGNIEGGDSLPMEINNQLFALIGTAERTTWEGVEAWYELHEKSFSPSGQGITPLVVEGPHSNTQDQMHLDTYAQQVAPNTIIHCGEISSNRNVSILTRKNGVIVKVKIDNLYNGVFSEWIERNATNVYDMTRKEQLNYAPNVLVHGSDSKNTTVFTTRDGTPEVTRFIEQHAIEVVKLSMNELTKFYGGAHCATSEVR